VICFTCREVEHRSNVCPKKNQSWKKKQDESKSVDQNGGGQEGLKHNEITVECCGHQLHVTLDRGETVTILPKEVVDAEILAGKMLQAKCANYTKMTMEEACVQIDVGSKKLRRRVRVVSGPLIHWTGLLSFNLSN